MIALLIAATSPELNLRGVTCVAGNVEIHHVARNTGKILRMVGRGDVPVSIGAARPLQRRLRTAPDTHGPTGTGYVELRGEDRQLGTTEYTAIPASRYLGAHRQPASGRDVGRRARAAHQPGRRESAGRRPRPLRAREVIWMGGTLEERGNTTETGEWNACVDPEAAEACLRAGAIHRIFPLDATQDVVFTMEDLRDPARHAPCRHRARRGPLLRRLPPAGRRHRRRLPARPGRADRLAAAAGPGDGGRSPRRSPATRAPTPTWPAACTARRPTIGRPSRSPPRIDAEGMKAELLARLARAVGAPYS